MDASHLRQFPLEPRDGRPALDNIYFLMNNADGIGGIARTAGRLASSLADRHSVELISLYRRREHPAYPLDPRVKVTYLIDARAGKEKGSGGRTVIDGPQSLHQLDSQPTQLAPEANEPLMSAMTDHLLARAIRSLPPGVLVATRPAMMAAAARFAPRRLLTVGQDHNGLADRSADPDLLNVILDSAPALDGFATFTEADAQDYRERLAGKQTMVVAIPSALPGAVAEQSDHKSKTVIAGGRLVEAKGFDRLVEAYVPVARRHPRWRLHIYGVGEQRGDLSRLISQRQLCDRVRLKGYSERFEDRLREASVFAMSSRSEGFGMALLEAMGAGLPLVSFDWPHGPAEMITDGRNGRLVPDGDIAGLSAALLQVVGDAELRDRMGRESLQAASAYEVDAIAARWEAWFEELLAGRD